MPDPHKIKEHKWLSALGPVFHEPNLLHFNRRSVSAGFLAGIFAAFIPLPMQMFLAVCLSITIRGNIAVAAASTWISNPLTFAPVFYFCYLIGIALIGEPLGDDGLPMAFNLSTVMNNLWTLGKPLLLGCLIAGTLFSGLSYLTVNYLWRFHIIRNWKIRRNKRKAEEPTNSE